MASGTKRYSVIVEMATKGARRTRKDISGVGGASNKAAGGVAALTTKFGALGAAGAALGLGVIVKQLGDLYAETVRLYSEQIRQERQVAAAIASTGKAANLSLGQIKGIASEIQSLTTFGDEAVLGMQALLLTFKKVQGDEFGRASKVIADMAVRMGGDDPASLKAAALQVGKALNDPVANLGALGEAGIQFSKDQKEVIKTLFESGEVAQAQTIILEELESQFAGSAAALRGDAVGAWEAAKNSWGDLLEELGSTSVVLIPVIQLLERFVTKMLTDFRKIKVGVFGILAAIAERAGSFVAGFAQMMAGMVVNIPGLDGVSEGLQKAAKRARDLGFELGGKLRKEARRTMSDLTDGLSDVEVSVGNVRGGVEDLGDANKDAAVAAAGLVAELQRVARLEEKIGELRGLARRGQAPTDLENAFFDLRGSQGAAIREHVGEEQFRILLQNIGDNFQDELEAAQEGSAEAMRDHYVGEVDYLADVIEDEFSNSAEFSAQRFRRSWGDVVFELRGALDAALSDADSDVRAIAGVLGDVAQGYADYKDSGGEGGFGDFMNQGGGGGGWGAILGVIGSGLITNQFGGGGQGKYGGELSGTYAEEGAAIGGAFGGVWAFYGAAIGSFIKKGAEQATARLAGMGTDTFFAEVEADTPGLQQTIERLVGTINDAFSGAVAAAGGEVLSSPEVSIKIRDDLISVWVGDMMEYQAASIEDAIYYALVQTMQQSEISGVAPEVLQAMMSPVRRSAEQLVQDVQNVQAVLDHNMGETSVLARDMGRNLAAARDRWHELGIEMGEFNKFAASQWQGLRDSILGIEKSFEQEIRSKANQFNAERLRQFEAIQRKLQEAVASMAEAVETDELRDKMREAGISFGDVANLVGEELMRAAVLVGEAGSITGASVEEVQGLIEKYRGALESLPDPISDEEVQDAIRRRKGGGGRNRREQIEDWREAVERLGQTLGPVASEIQSVADAWNAEIDRGKELGQAIDELVESRDAEIEAVKEASLDQFVIDWVTWFNPGGPVENAMRRFGAEAENMRERLRDLHEAGVITTETFEALMAAVGPEAWRKAAEFSRQFADSLLIELYGYLGREGDAKELSWELTKAELEMKRAQLKIAAEEGHLTQEAFKRISDLVDDVLEGPVGGVGGGGGGGHGAVVAYEWHNGHIYAVYEDGYMEKFQPPGAGGGGTPGGGDRGMDRWLSRLDSAAGGNFTSAEELRERFQELYDSMPQGQGLLDDFQKALEEATESLRENLVEGLREVREEILGGAGGGLSGRELYTQALERFHETMEGVRGGDLEDVAALPDVVRDLLGVAGDYLGNASLGGLERMLLAALRLAEQIEIDAGVKDGEVVVNGEAPTAPLNRGGYQAGVMEITSTNEAGFGAIVSENRLLRGEQQLTRAEIRGLRSDLSSLLNRLDELERAS